MDSELKYHDCRNDPEVESSWAEYDGRGIYLYRVCWKCRSAKLGTYRRKVLRTFYSENDVCEQIEPDEW